MRQHRANACGFGLEAVEAQQRVQPDQAAATLGQALHLVRQRQRVAVLEAVADQQHRGAAAQGTARPALVELVQAGRDARAARPVFDRAHHVGHRDIGVAALQQARGARQPRAEDETLDTRLGVAQCMREVQQHARVAAHRARDVGQHHHRRWQRARPPPAQLAQFAAVARHRLQRAAPVDAAGTERAFAAPRGQRLEHPAHLRQRAASGAPLVSAHGVEVGLAQHLAIAHRERGVELHLVVGLRLRCVGPGVGEQRVAQAPVLALLGQQRLLRAHLGQQHRAHAAFEVGVAPEQIERLVEKILVLDAVEHASDSTAWKSRLLSKPASLSACNVSCARSVPTAMPAERNTRAKCITFSARWPGAWRGATSMGSTCPA